MKRVITFILLACCTFYAGAQENLHYQWMDSYGKNTPNNRMAYNPGKIDIPGVGAFNAYTADLHMHTIYSDAEVSPEMRVYEAYLEGIDILAITDHHPVPRVYRGTDDLNAGYDFALKAVKKGDFDLKLIRGLEITGSEPVGHICIIFAGDLNQYRLDKNFGPKECDELLQLAKKEDAFVTTNHPGWPDQNSDLNEYIINHIKAGDIGGIEVFNSKEFYPLAIDHANKYKLAMLGCTDSHYPTSQTFDLKSNHRDLTIIFAADKSDEALKEALRAGRTLAWANNTVCGEEALLREFVKACIRPVFVRSTKDGDVHLKLYNCSSIPFYLTTEDSNDNLFIPAGGYVETKRKKSKLGLSYKVDNAYCTSSEHPSFPLNFLLDGNEVTMPFINEESLCFNDNGLSFSFASSLGTIRYTIDGSDPTEESAIYEGGDITLTNSAVVKAVNFVNGKRSSVYERQLPFAMAGKFKGRKQGINFSMYKDVDIYSTEEIEKTGKPSLSGRKSSLEISEGIGTDYFAYIFEGVVKIGESGLYRFSLMTNDGSDLYIDDVLACDNNVRSGYTTGNGKIWLQKGLHKLRIRYFEGYGGESFDLKWQVPGSNNAQDFPCELLYVE